jgi:3-oxoacyl-[acyl-carrier-protein] synthase II
LAALALNHGQLFPPGDASGVEKPGAGPVTRAVVTSVGHWRSDGMALVEPVR